MIFNRIKRRIESKPVNKKKFYAFASLFIVIVIGHIWFRDTSNNISIEASQNLSEDYPKLSVILSKFGDYTALKVCTFIISVSLLNFSNIFKLLLFYLVFYLSIGFSALLRLSYRHEMLFQIADRMNIDLEPINCTFSWATICSESTAITALLLSLGYMLVENKKWFAYIKILIFAGIFSLIVFFNFCIFCCKLYTINDLIFSVLIGIFISIFFAFIMSINLNKSQDMRSVVSKSVIIYITFNLLMIGSILTLYLLSENLYSDDHAVQSIKRTECFKIYPDNTDMSFDSLILLILYTTNFVVFLAIYLDLKYFSLNDYTKWGFFNFEDDQNDLESLYSYHEDVKNSQWNNTTQVKTFLRIIISFAVLSLSILPSVLIPYQTQDLILIFLKYFLPFLYEVFCVLFLLKLIFIKLNLVNIGALTLFNKNEGSENINDSEEVSVIGEISLTQK